MFKRSLPVYFLLLFLFMVQSLGAASSKPEVAPPCTLPAPTNLQAAPVGSTYATLSWDAVSGAWGYSIHFAGGAAAIYVTTSTSWNLTGLTPGVTYTAEVHAMCGVGSESPNLAATSFSTIVVEVICQAVPCTPGSLIGSGQDISHNWEPGVSYCFTISNLSKTARYTFQKTLSNGVPVQPMTSSDSGFSLGMSNGRYCPTYSGTTDQFLVKYNGDVIAAGKIEEGAIHFLLATGYSAAAYNSTCSPPPIAPGIQTDERAATDPTDGELRPSPNPFDDELILHGSAGRSDDPVRLALFDAQGVPVRQREAVIVGAYTLPTTDLPAGVYFLQVRTSSTNTTYKLLKM